MDTTIGIFNLGQFEDDKNLSRLRTLTAHYPPAEVRIQIRFVVINYYRYQLNFFNSCAFVNVFIV